MSFECRNLALGSITERRPMSWRMIVQFGALQMNPNLMLTITSLVSIVLMTIHISDDIARGLDSAGPQNVGGVAIFVVWLYGTLVVRERLAGQIIVLLGGVFAAAMPILHMRGKSYPEIVTSDGGLFFVWVLFMVGTTGVFSVILAVTELWDRGRNRSAKQ
jgi:hypothetical protein